MDFGNQYLTYQEYKELGGSLDNTPFNLLEYKSRKQIDRRTFGRLIGQEIPNEVKLCVNALININESYTEFESINSNISSESIDGYSISYATPQKSIIEAKNSELNGTIEDYLSNTIINGVPVLYRGVDYDNE